MVNKNTQEEKKDNEDNLKGITLEEVLEFGYKIDNWEGDYVPIDKIWDYIEDTGWAKLELQGHDKGYEMKVDGKMNGLNIKVKSYDVVHITCDPSKRIYDYNIDLFYGDRIGFSCNLSNKTPYSCDISKIADFIRYVSNIMLKKKQDKDLENKLVAERVNLENEERNRELAKQIRLLMRKEE